MPLWVVSPVLTILTNIVMSSVIYEYCRIMTSVFMRSVLMSNVFMTTFVMTNTVAPTYLRSKIQTNKRGKSWDWIPGTQGLLLLNRLPRPLLLCLLISQLCWQRLWKQKYYFISGYKLARFEPWFFLPESRRGRRPQWRQPCSRGPFRQRDAKEIKTHMKAW